ncbi:MAG: hypothetical protein A2046_14890 [Bacteroidetes bacterium GWA2_30_7]|nr:MAG: hypothetical protein A2046_14890 [Bacteroidetes bacterium GWA2_30_7]
MNIIKNLYNKIKLFPLGFSIILGIIAFLFITKGLIINPKNVDWLLEGDPATNYLGWQFYRAAPILQFPFGLNPNYGIELSSSIVFTDSIPIMAFIFKPFNYFLPSDFQYIGIWILLCFILQSFFAIKLLSKFSDNKLIIILYSTFFLIAPFLLNRLNGHYSLFGQWIILAAIYLYFNTVYKNKFWILLLCISSLMHAYILLMILSIWILDLIQRIIGKEVKIKKIILFFPINVFITFLTMWAAGYFVILHGTNKGGFGYYCMNILSFINPNFNWSSILPRIDCNCNEFESFNYLGIGIIVLLFISIILSFKLKNIKFNYRIILLIILCFLFYIYSLSNKVSFGTTQIFSYPLPHFLDNITDSFRSSSRFFWPVAYLLFLFIFYILIKTFKQIFVIVIISILLIVQVIDSYSSILNFNKIFTKSNSFNSPLRNDDWNKIAVGYKKIYYVLPDVFPKNWLQLSEFAVSHNMSINAGYFARVDEKKFEISRKLITESVISNNYESDALYIFNDEKLWHQALQQIKPEDFAGEKDGYNFIAPDFKYTSDFKQFIAKIRDNGSPGFGAIKLTGDKLFGLSTKIQNINTNDILKVSVWRKTNTKKGKLVVTAENVEEFNVSTGTAIEKNSEGWEKLYLEVVIPEKMKGKSIKVYVWNPDKNSEVYFDDLIIEKLSK